MKIQKILLPIIIIIGALAFFSIFIVKEVNQAIVLQFGDPKKIILKPGLNFKIPFIQNVVFLDGRIVDSCLVLAVEVEGKSVSTIEGVADVDKLHPVQQAFLENAALQCGICTPGFIMAAKALLEKEPDADEGRIRLWLAGNLCRCTGYDKIIRAVQSAGKDMQNI